MRLGLSAAVLMTAGAVGAKEAPVQPPGRSVHIATKAYDFSYSYPAAAGRIPALKEWLDADFLRKRARIIKDTDQELKDAGGVADMASHFKQEVPWQVVDNLPGWLSLSAQIRYLSGGAHSNYWFETVLWDKAANRKRDALSLFVSKAEFTKALRQKFCTELNRQRARMNDVSISDYAGECHALASDALLDPADEVVVLGSSDHTHFNWIGILIKPYDADGFAAGSYDITLPVTPAIIAAVRPEYRAAFAVPKSSATR